AVATTAQCFRPTRLTGAGAGECINGRRLFSRRRRDAGIRKQVVNETRPVTLIWKSCALHKREREGLLVSFQIRLPISLADDDLIRAVLNCLTIAEKVRAAHGHRRT